MLNRSNKISHLGLFSFYGLSVLLLLFGSSTAEGATYYVATSGSDANPGTSSNPWRNPQKCAASPIQAGDTCIVRKGTYEEPNRNGIVVYVRASSPAGTASQPITIKSETPLDAKIIIPSSVNAANAGFYVTRPYYIIEGFDISGGENDGDSASHHAITFSPSATGGIARLNSIHHVGRTVCSDTVYGFDGVFVHATSDVLIERNTIYSIGRLRDGENGCSTIRFQNDHGIYAAATTNLTIRRNVFYDTNRGWPIHIYKSREKTTNLNISHNTLAGRSPTGKPYGHILLANTINGASIKNNISVDAQTGMVNAYALTATDIIVSHNLSDTLEKTGLSMSGVTFTNNIQRNTNLGFIDKSRNDFRLTSASAAINRGTTVGVPPVRDGAPDIGAYEFSEQDDVSYLAAPTGLNVR